MEDLELCPLEKNWIMLATWLAAHPFGPGGIWQNAGGDYADDNCISAAAGDEADELVFDISD
jgi:hypothetical protein